MEGNAVGFNSEWNGGRAKAIVKASMLLTAQPGIQ